MGLIVLGCKERIEIPFECQVYPVETPLPGGGGAGGMGLIVFAQRTRLTELADAPLACRAGRLPGTNRTGTSCVAPPAGLHGVVGTGLLCDVSTLCAVVPPAGLYGVVGTGLLCDVSTLCAVVPPAGLYGVVGTGMLWDVSTWRAPTNLSTKSTQGAPWPWIQGGKG
jgi:hypothetical protein